MGMGMDMDNGQCTWTMGMLLQIWAVKVFAHAVELLLPGGQPKVEADQSDELFGAYSEIFTLQQTF